MKAGDGEKHFKLPKAECEEGRVNLLYEAIEVNSNLFLKGSALWLRLKFE